MAKKQATQEKIIIAFMGFITLTTLFPPFKQVADGATSNAGYSFILFPPKGANWSIHIIPTVDLGTLIAEWGFALILATAAWLLVKIRNNGQKA
jgi:hypothetical protein